MPVRELVKVVVNTEDVYVVVHLRSEFESSRGLLHRKVLIEIYGYLDIIYGIYSLYVKI